MIETKDYSLLRPFDPEAAKRGELVCATDGATEYEFVAEGTPRPTGESIAVRVVKSFYHKNTGWLYLCGPENLRMAPLCWVEGHPVYRGEVLYRKDNGMQGSATDAIDGFLVFSEWPNASFSPSMITWTPPKVKREVKLLAFIDDQGFLRHVREELFCNRGVRVPHLDYLIPVEEPVRVAK